MRFIAVSQIRPSCKNDENYSYVVVYFKRNLRNDGEAHEQNLAIKPAPHTVLSTNGINFAGAFMATNKSEKKTNREPDHLNCKNTRSIQLSGETI